MAMVSFDKSVEQIIKLRRANPAITIKHQLSTDFNAVGDELEQYTRMRLGLAPMLSADNPLPKSVAPGMLALVSGAAADIRRAAQGTAVVMDWLVSGGKPVAQDLANKRAATCVACPQNVDGSWYTTAPAEIIRSTLSARADLKLETPSDASLKSCNVCRCLNRLKVWCPLDHILAKTKPEVMREFPSHCWIAKRDQGL
jgi:hypothetical protein